MHTIVIFLYKRSQAREAFRSFRLKALFSSIRSKLFGYKNKLQDFAEQKGRITVSSRYLGVLDISIDQIVGSLGRKDDFDRQFHPLKDNLRERWVNIYLCMAQDELPAIQVYQVGEHYYVVDGHHRVSTASYTGRKFIQAEVWNYPLKTTCRPSSAAFKKDPHRVSNKTGMQARARTLPRRQHLVRGQ